MQPAATDYLATPRVWRISLEQPAARVATLSTLLSEQERRRADGFRFEKHRRRFVVRRAALRLILGCRLGVPAIDVPIETTSLGRPLLTAAMSDDWAFSTSHSGEIALVALAAGDVLGVDIEALRPMDDLDAIAARHFAPEELAWVRGAAPGAAAGADRLDRFYRCWVLKEAFVKALGEGLHRPLESVAFDAARTPPRLLRAAGVAPADWRFRLFVPEPGWIAALAGRPGPLPEPDVRFWSFEDTPK